MIIKSMPRKDASFGQLINYITDEGKAEQAYFYGHNTFTNNPQEALKAMEENARHIKARKNGNYMYHEVVSITREQDLDEKRQKDALRDIAIKYVEERARNSLAFCALHDDHEGHLHYHIMISANEISNSKKNRLSKSEFDQIKKRAEQYAREQYPELKQKLLIGQDNKDQNKNIQSDKETQVKQRGKSSKVDHISEAVGLVLNTVKNEDQLKAALKQYGFEYYRRGNTPGIIDTEDNKKYRFKRLGLLIQYQDMIDGKNNNTSYSKPDGSTFTEKDKEEEITTKDKLKEWVLGDFEKRERKAQTDKIKKRQTKAKDGLTTSDKAKEWVFGDFSARDDIKTQKDYERIQEIIKANPDLTEEQIRREWLYGDFSGRKEQENAERIKKWMDKRQEDKMQSIQNEREQQMKQKRENQKGKDNDKDLGRHK